MTDKKRGLASNPLFTKTDQDPDATDSAPNKAEEDSSQEQVAPRQQPAPAEEQAVPTQQANQANQTGSNDAYGRTDETGVRTVSLLQHVPPTPENRRPERYAFQFWADQITRLKKLKQVLNVTKDPEDREEISLSDMVREAIDDYLEKKMAQLEQRKQTEE